jgi:hypothetical protein
MVILAACSRLGDGFFQTSWKGEEVKSVEAFHAHGFVLIHPFAAATGRMKIQTAKSF